MTINVYALGGVIAATAAVKLTALILRYRATQRAADRKAFEAQGARDRQMTAMRHTLETAPAAARKAAQEATHG